MKSDGGQDDRSAKRAPRRRGNGQGTAIKRGSTWSAVWTVEVYVEPGTMKLRQRQKWKGGFATKREALNYAANPPAEEKRQAHAARLLEQLVGGRAARSLQVSCRGV